MGRKRCHDDIFQEQLRTKKSEIRVHFVLRTQLLFAQQLHLYQLATLFHQLSISLTTVVLLHLLIIRAIAHLIIMTIEIFCFQPIDSIHHFCNQTFHLTPISLITILDFIPPQQFYQIRFGNITQWVWIRMGQHLIGSYNHFQHHNDPAR